MPGTRCGRSALIALMVTGSLVSGMAFARTAPPADRISASTPLRPQARYSWPLAPPHPVVRGFRPPETPYGVGHRGVDLAAPEGAGVFAAADGLVVYAGPLAGRGVVSIEHDGGLRTTYEPVDPLVEVGKRVSRGQLIGHLQGGHPGCPPGSVCLHWGARRALEYLDPLRLVGAGTVRLLPWRESDGS